MVINAIEIKILMVRTVAQCVKTKINQIFPQTTNLCVSYGGVNEDHVSWDICDYIKWRY